MVVVITTRVGIICNEVLGRGRGSVIAKVVVEVAILL